MKKNKFTLSVERNLKKLAPRQPKDAFGIDYMLGGDKNDTKCELKFLNLSMPQVRGFLKELPDDVNFDDVENLFFTTSYFEARTLALCWLDDQDDVFLIAHTNPILSWADAVDNWAHADGLCSVLARLFEKNFSAVLPTYKKWNKHPRSWNRRCSLVGTFYYSRSRKKQPEFALIRGFVAPHFSAQEYYVQKAVGWTIREMYNAYPDETIKFIENNLGVLSAVAWVAASEKLPARLKSSLLKKRKTLRR